MVFGSFLAPSSGAPSMKSFNAIHIISAPPQNFNPFMPSSWATRIVRATLNIIAPPAPKAIPSDLCFLGRFRTAIAITTALSPARTRSIRTTIKKPLMNSHVKLKYPKLPKFIIFTPSPILYLNYSNVHPVWYFHINTLYFI